tara:strand:- start:2238 stop:3278 length:1041 start_codon:yes stop_codon:yes gene_type:complete
MLGTYNYNSIIKKTVVGFGTLFNNIEIRRVSGSKTEVMKVPLAYGPKAKFLARLRQVGDLTTQDQLQITLPRISFEIQGINYDPTRKVSPTQYIRNTSGNKENKGFMPVPYNINFELAILSKNQDDALQILEQILPFFQPSFNITMNLVPELGEKKDYPVTLTSIDYADEYEGDYDTRRTLIYTLQFIAKTYLYGPISDTSGKVIKKTIVDYSAQAVATAPREVRYVATPRSLVERDNSAVTTVSADIDDNDGIINVADASGISLKDDIQIDTEVMRVTKIDSNKIYVARAWNNSTVASHVSSSNVFIITTTDHQMVDSDDDFGFNELYSDFTDGKSRNPTTGSDE